MNEFLNSTENGTVVSKTWKYTETSNKVATHHTLSINGKRLTHIEESKDASHTSKLRTDISLDKVVSVSTYYGTKRNMTAVIFCAVIAFILFVIAMTSLMNEGVVFGIIFLLFAVLFGYLAWLNYNNVKPSFALVIETLYPMGNLSNHNFSYGNPDFSFGSTTSNSPFSAFINSIKKLFKPKSKYSFEMDAATGEEILNVLGEILIER